jgi:hypothetical protein|tara:strand:- start:3261 stop:3854 length:594 start_codon:yes stop_codon:yes gene_type:complete
MNEKKVSINNFIGIYDNYILPQECDKAIEYFEKQNALKKAYDRLQSENTPLLLKNDRAITLNEHVNTWFEEFKPLLVNFDLALRHYQDSTGILVSYNIPSLKYTDIKIQKTLPTQGYHIWHLEHGNTKDNAYRGLVYTIYLNDVEEGGETEFLHFSKRVKPKKGRIVIWPASFPYVHRGNPPLSGEKYILTSWLMLS